MNKILLFLMSLSFGILGFGQCLTASGVFPAAAFTNMKKYFKLICLMIILSNSLHTQTLENYHMELSNAKFSNENSFSSKTTCSGTFTAPAGNCQAFQIGNGTPGTIQVCITTNNIGTSNCNPGGACNPPFNGGGWSPRIAVYNSAGAGATTFVNNFTSGSAAGSCITVTSTTGYAYIYGVCMGTNTAISWTTINACGDQVCTGTPPPCVIPCSTCGNACGSCGYPSGSNPTPTQVVNNYCSGSQGYPYTPNLTTGQSSTRCHQFTPTSTTVDFRIVLSAACSGTGNVTNFSWTLQEPSCGANIATGTNIQPTFTGLTIGETYTFCYTFTVPTNCTFHSSHYPYFIGANTVLPVDLLDFYGDYNEKSNVNELVWKTASETNSSHFILQRSDDNIFYQTIDKIQATNTSTFKQYDYIDRNFTRNSVNYYRLYQYDFDGSETLLNTIYINNFNNKTIDKVINILGQTVDINTKGLIILIYTDGSTEKIYK
jgi:hypothetical protein